MGNSKSVYKRPNSSAKTATGFAAAVACAVILGTVGVSVSGAPLENPKIVNATAVESMQAPSQKLTFTFKPEIAAHSTGALVGGTSPNWKNVRLTLNGTRVLCAPAKGVRIFLNLPEADQMTPITDPHYVSSLAFFPGLSGSCDEAAKQTFKINLQDTFLNLLAQGRVNERSPLMVTIVPIAGSSKTSIPLVAIDKAELSYEF